MNRRVKDTVWLKKKVSGQGWSDTHFSPSKLSFNLTKTHFFRWNAKVFQKLFQGRMT